MWSLVLAMMYSPSEMCFAPPMAKCRASHPVCVAGSWLFVGTAAPARPLNHVYNFSICCSCGLYAITRASGPLST